MGISDDIKPKRSSYSGHDHYSNSDHLFDDLDDIEIKKPAFHHSAAEHQRKEYESREDLENEFFANQIHKKEEPKHYDPDEEEPEQPQKHTHHKHKNGRFAKVMIWFMVLALAGLLVWQNKSDIITLVKEKVLKEKTASSPVEDQKTDDYYSGETTSNTNSNANNNSNTNAVNTNAATAQTAAPSSINKAGVKIEILNGNGIKNSGAKLKSDLVSAGFTIEKTANAKNFNYATTLIYYKTGKDAEADLVKSTITGKDVTMENNDTLAGAYDVVIVLGAK